MAEPYTDGEHLLTPTGLYIGLIANFTHMCGYCIIGFVPLKFLAYIIESLAAFTFISLAVVNGMVSLRLGPEEQGAGLSALQALGSICGCVGPLFALMYAKGREVDFPELPFAVGLVILAASAALPLLIRREDLRRSKSKGPA